MLSLIQTSQNRQNELIRFIDSLNNQENIEFSKIQLIFIDQGSNRELFSRLNSEIDFTYQQTSICSLSHARNLGLSRVKGEYVAFPDDDCWYEKDTLFRILQYLEGGSYQGVSGKGTNEKSELTSIFPKKAALLTAQKRCAAISYTLFFKYDSSLIFDEDMGVGSPYNIGAGEETDYLLSLMEKRNYRIYYDPSIIIHHPTSDIYDKDSILKRSYSYARGAGYLMQKHSFPISYKIKQFIRPLGGIIIHFLKFDFFACHKSYLILKGRLEGYNWRKNDKVSR